MVVRTVETVRRPVVVPQVHRWPAWLGLALAVHAVGGGCVAIARVSSTVALPVVLAPTKEAKVIIKAFARQPAHVTHRLGRHT